MHTYATVSILTQDILQCMRFEEYVYTFSCFLYAACDYGIMCVPALLKAFPLVSPEHRKTILAEALSRTVYWGHYDATVSLLESGAVVHDMSRLAFENLKIGNYALARVIATHTPVHEFVVPCVQVIISVTSVVTCAVFTVLYFQQK